MTYQETLDFLFNALPMFQRVGASAFKKDLSNTYALCEYLGQPQQKFKSIHVAGTNGKGSTSHAICSVLMESGYKVGLYTSPHLKSFTERIKINGREIPENEVVDFVAKHKPFLEKLKPSFFEMTVAMAFWYFAKEEVDIAVIEVGMGGRLDSTNVITPEVAVITNIGFDHMQFLGDTLEKIAGEKAGIIKKEVPVVISTQQEDTKEVFEKIASVQQAPIYFAQSSFQIRPLGNNIGHKRQFEALHNGLRKNITLDLLGNYQRDNLPGILQAIEVLTEKGFKISEDHISQGLSQVIKNTGLKGRWQVLGESPWIICDTGHNEDGIKYILNQINEYTYNQLFMIIGMVNDKDVSKVLSFFPKNAQYVFCQANIPRAMPAEELFVKAKEVGLEGFVTKDVNEAMEWAKKKARKEDLIFIGGSTFVVAEIKEL
ncbi:bifunctional folylpolyglutamate synthase/dihydrofolate synthase [Cecembia lonarensis]|uniref:Dihydrofolate synthase/folylpolyglutamate synthase n=1 Tax=Cecembia lonarensis (strain CCUG 58316 / KCTC 22772 / LW9) TaxID=1225176 RepID=K1LKK6_CECL9|nr:folylpolyglutamate synthase/dihydrofolate synthase family protein [Cecembia lonarensis]EKB50908.1 Folylpolyglutamate synthase [Cecembia lonarensis LW9]